MHPQPAGRRTKLLAALLVLGPGNLFAAGSADTFDEALERIYTDERSVVSGQELVELMDDNEIGRQLYLLDMRSKDEWHVSRIAGAEYIGYGEFSLDAVSHIPRDARVVLYCAVGWRSGRVGRRMRDAGFENVQDLYGGILNWTDNGHPVVNDNGVTPRVHGSQRRWGRWVQNPNVEVVYRRPK